MRTGTSWWPTGKEKIHFSASSAGAKVFSPSKEVHHLGRGPHINWRLALHLAAPTLALTRTMVQVLEPACIPLALILHMSEVISWR